MNKFYKTNFEKSIARREGKSASENKKKRQEIEK